MNDLFTGKLTRLSAIDPETMAPYMARWGQDDTYMRFLDTAPPLPFSEKKIKAWLEEDLKKDPLRIYFFCIRTLADDQIIGFLDFFPTWQHRDAWVGIGIGERDFWGKGYGTDAMQSGLKFAFHEMNLERVTLGVFGYNQRAFRSYQKAGFHLEGVEREYILRDGKRYDINIMGILREEWQQEC